MECPVCGCEFSPATINTHVNECLNSKQDRYSKRLTVGVDADDKDEQPKSQSQLNGPAKRKRASDWGSLQPMRSSKECVPASSNSNAPKTNKRAKKDFGAKRSGAVSSNIKPMVSNEGFQDDSEVKCLEPCSISDAEERPDESPTSSSLQSQNLPSALSSSTKTSTVQRDQTSPPQRNKPISKRELFAPLAEQARPTDLDSYVGQDKAVGKDSMLYSLLSSDYVPSIILWGPPGCGKTTLARIIANNCRSRGSAKFVSLSAAVCGVSEVKDTIKIARNDQKMFHKKTVVFLDEIHRFNKTQQDILLPHVEDGTITLIGATTENPSFQVNSALLSRCRVIVLDKLSGDNILNILQQALPHIGATAVESEDFANGFCEKPDAKVYVDNKALALLSNLVDGDARAALNGLQMAVQAKLPDSLVGNKSVGQRKTCGTSHSKGIPVVTTEDIKEGLQRSHVLYDKTGEEHYNIISALHKSMRGSDASASLYWLARMLEGGENPLYIARRLIRFASEDIGLTDPLALTQAVSAYQGCHLIGMPECEVLLAQCAVYMARAPKSVEIYQAYKQAKSCVKNHHGPLPSVPLHLRNAPTKLMKSLGYSKGYKYNPDYTEPVVQDYFPEELLGTDFFS